MGCTKSELQDLINILYKRIRDRRHHGEVEDHSEQHEPHQCGHHPERRVVGICHQLQVLGSNPVQGWHQYRLGRNCFGDRGDGQTEKVLDQQLIRLPTEYRLYKLLVGTTYCTAERPGRFTGRQNAGYWPSLMLSPENSSHLIHVAQRPRSSCCTWYQHLLAHKNVHCDRLKTKPRLVSTHKQTRLSVQDCAAEKGRRRSRQKKSLMDNVWTSLPINDRITAAHIRLDWRMISESSPSPPPPPYTHTNGKPVIEMMMMIRNTQPLSYYSIMYICGESHAKSIFVVYM
ncbi:hypothetical protein DPMN_107700 [Dreissena polymorpha]|uniref:Uncharacterized protein n=1 Tax=Dreissena polymorpha TaxID=45954 RepID=A0A9D4QLA4_DREPO|nr:hypothetical protein DPMN_107700 [Dreissena polymorpha]